MTASDRPPEPQYPAPTVPAEPAPGEPPLLPLPGERAQAVAARHLAEHGVGSFAVERHVYRGGPRLPEQLLLWNPAKATFDCRVCNTIIATGEITDEVITTTLLFDEGLKTFLAGAHTPAERKEIARRYLSGELSAAVLQLSRRAARRRLPKQARPAVEHRIARMQEWMLERFEIEGVVERVIEEAQRLQQEEPELWALVCDKPRAASTLRRDWQQIPAERVEQAKRAHAQREVDLSR